MRIGYGWDSHEFQPGIPLKIGGVELPHTHGLAGHSDGDVLLHAITDALLGAVAAGDIGSYFPPSDPKWKGASSIALLRDAVAMIAAQGFSVANVDVTVILESPKIKDYIDAMRVGLAGALGVDPTHVSIKGKTNEGVDAVGRGEAIAAHAVALLRGRS